MTRRFRKLAVIARPPSDEARTRELREAVDLLRADGCQVDMQVTFEPGDAERHAAAAARAGAEVVVAAGGDGTVNEVVNGLVAAETDAALAVVALGTANDFARGLGLPLDVTAALRLAAEGTASELDVARVNQRCFINVSTGGFGAEATRAASRSVKQRLGALAYVYEGAQLLWHYSPSAAIFTADGRVMYSGRYVFFAVGNSRRTGGGAHVTPLADPGDGKLDIAILCDVSRLDFLTLLPDLRAGSHIESPNVLYLQAHTFEVRSERELKVNADGEPVAGRLFHYGVLDRGLRVVGA
jgi:diacylglycerol kinase (ATP)